MSQMNQMREMNQPHQDMPGAERETSVPAVLPRPGALPGSFSLHDDDFPDPAEALEHSQWRFAVRRAEQTPGLGDWGARGVDNTVLMRADPEALLDLVDAMHSERRDAAAWEKERAALYGPPQEEPGPLDYFAAWFGEGMDISMANLHSFLALQARYWGHGTFIDSEGERQSYSSALLNGFADERESAARERLRSRPAPLEPKTPFGRYMRDFVRQIPQVGMQLGVTAVHPVAGLALAGANIAGGQYRELTEQGVDPDRAFAASMANAGLQIPLEWIGMSKLGAVGKARGVREFLKRVMAYMGSEASTEYLQSYPEAATSLWATLRDDEGAQAWFDHFIAALPETHRDGLYAAALAAPFGVLGGFGKAARASERARRAEGFHDGQLALHERVEAVDMKSFAPRYLEEMLHAAGLEKSVFLPASDLLTLHESGTGILAFLGVSPRAAREAAAQGQNVELPLARLHAFLAPDEFAAVARIMRESPNQPTMMEARDLDKRLAADAAETAAVYADYAAQREAIGTELNRIRREAAEALPASAAKGEDALAAGDAYAGLLLAWAQRREARSGVPIVESLRRFRVMRGEAEPQRLGSDVERAFFQPLNDGVELDALVPAVVISPRFTGQNPKVLRKRFPADVRQAVLAEFSSPEGVVNADTGWRVGMSGADFHEHLKFSDTDAIGGLAQLEAVAALPALMRNAKLVETYQDKKNVFQIKKMHRFQAALCIGDKAYSVKLTVKEYKNGELILDMNTPLRLYHHRLEKEMPAGNSYKAPFGVTHKPSADIPAYTVRQLLEDVKDSEGNIFFVTGGSLHQKEQISFVKDKYQTPDEAFTSGNEAMNKVITQQTDVLDAMFRPDVGSISFYWGKPGIGPKFKKGSGVAHLIAHRKAQGLDGEGIARKMPEVLAYGQISGRQNAAGGDRVFISYDNHTAVLSLYRFGNRETWLVTGWLDNNSPDVQVKVNDSTSTTNIEPTRFQSGDGAGDGQIDIQPLGSDGKPLFHSADSCSPRGSITPVDEGYLIRLYDKADLSTILHESGHFFLLEMEQDIHAGIADASTVQDLAAIRRWLGAHDNAPLTREQHEQFARGFERYLREGKAPSSELQSLFARFRQWLIHLYRKAARLDVKLNDDVRAVFNRLLAEDAAPATKTRPPKPSPVAPNAVPTAAAAPRPAPLLREGLTRKPDNATARVVTLPENAVPNFAGMKEFAAWLKDMLAEGGDIEIASTGHMARFTRTNVGASVKRSRSQDHRNAYAGLREMVRNAEYDHYEVPDERHPNSGGQDVYYSALHMGNRLYSVKLKLDVVAESVRKARENHGETEIEDVHYKDHKLSEIEIAPALYRDAATKPFTQPADAISEISLGVLRGSVNPSRIEHGALYQLNSRVKGEYDSAPRPSAPVSTAVPTAAAAPRPGPRLREGLTRKPDDATAKVVTLPENAVPNFAGMKEFAAWLKEMLAEEGNVLIKSTGQEARFSSGNVKASLKRSRSQEHRNAYAGLREMVENAEYDHYEAPDERHPDRGGQDVYYSALRMGGKLYSVKLKLDVVTEPEKRERVAAEDVRYKDHKLTEIEIALAQDRGISETGESAHGTDAISEVSLGVLRGAVNPSRIEHGALYQPARE